MVKWLFLFLIGGVLTNIFAEKRTVEWFGGGMECDTRKLFSFMRQCHSENVIATKALTVNNEVFIITPRIKKGIPASVWKVIQNATGVLLQPFLDQSFHSISDCKAVQNAVDFHLDAMGNLWILDSGVIETLTNPKCTCLPKVTVVNVFQKRAKVKKIDLSSVVLPESDLQSIIVDLRIGRSPFMYISDAGAGRIIILDVSTNKQWTVKAGEPTLSMRLALLELSPGNRTLVAIRHNETGWLEGDTARLRQKGSYRSIKFNNEDMPAITLLGSDFHHIYFRYHDARDVLSWKVRQPFTNTSAQLIHAPEPELNTMSLTIDNLNNFLILDSNSNSSKENNVKIHHKLIFIPRIKS